MKRTKRLAMVISMVGLVLATAGPAAGQPMMGGYGMGPGRMGGYGGYGMGPGMMGGYDMGPGMMGGYGMGPGMMGGYGMGPGMMGGYGSGPGTLSVPDLDQQQQTKIAKIQDEAQRKQWDLIGQMREEQLKLQQLYYLDKQDPAAIGAQYKRVQDLQRQMVELSATTQNQVESVLKPEQRQQVRRYWRGGIGCCW